MYVTSNPKYEYDRWVFPMHHCKDTVYVVGTSVKYASNNNSGCQSFLVLFPLSFDLFLLTKSGQHNDSTWNCALTAPLNGFPQRKKDACFPNPNAHCHGQQTQTPLKALWCAPVSASLQSAKAASHEPPKADKHTRGADEFVSGLPGDSSCFSMG